jgi:hypothetical protein
MVIRADPVDIGGDYGTGYGNPTTDIYIQPRRDVY